MKNKIWLIVVVASLLLSTACAGKKNTDATRQHSQHNANQPDSPETDTISLTIQQEQYANITIDTVKVKTIAEYTTLPGTTSFDERRVSIVTSRIRGRLDKLFVRNPQDMVTRGQPLYSIYSEELLSYENELLNALRQQAQFSSIGPGMDQLVDAARKNLLLWGLTQEQVAALEKKGEASPLATFYSPVTGTLVELPVSEGQYVEIGTPLFRFADLSQLWIEAQMYTSELRWLYEKPVITAELDAFPGEIISVSPVYDNPSIETDQKISLVRFLLPNRRLHYKPGMMAYVSIGRNGKRTLVIPKSSLLIGNMVTAWVKTGDGTYQNRMIEVGIQNKKEVEVIKGLKKGELIVTNGAYLLNSALVLKKGAGMQGMKM